MTVNKNIRTAYIAVGLLLVIVAIGVIGYSILGYTFTEAFFIGTPEAFIMVIWAVVSFSFLQPIKLIVNNSIKKIKNDFTLNGGIKINELTNFFENL